MKIMRVIAKTMDPQSYGENSDMRIFVEPSENDVSPELRILWGIPGDYRTVIERLYKNKIIDREDYEQQIKVPLGCMYIGVDTRGVLDGMIGSPQAFAKHCPYRYIKVIDRDYEVPDVAYAKIQKLIAGAEEAASEEKKAVRKQIEEKGFDAVLEEKLNAIYLQRAKYYAERAKM